MRRLGLVIFTLVLLTAADWPQWRGPNRDGVAADPAPKAWPKMLSAGWSVTVGEGHSTPVVVKDRVYVHARQKDDEVILALNLADGKELWRLSNPAPYTMHQAATGHGKGPKATPTFSDGRLYTFGISGVLSCVEAATGKLLWRKDASPVLPLYGTATSPLVADGLCVSHMGGHDKGALTAFDAVTGETKWVASTEGPSYASPILATVAGVRQIITQTQTHVVGVSFPAGKLLWKIPFNADYDSNAVTAVVHNDILIYSGENQPLYAVKFEKRGETITPKPLWEKADLPLYMSTPVLREGVFFALTMKRSGQLFAADIATGKVIWSNDGRVGENAALVRAGDDLLVLSNTGKLTVVSTTEKIYKTKAEYKVSETQTWAHPVYLGDKILIKDFDTLKVWELK